ncbi:cyclase family protein [Candidatus Shapirobacteria bacterium]|nr:cyclase family protein [Candidatus Shapirobacteria bacterium]
MKIYDVTLPIHKDMLVWEGDESVSIEQTATLAKDEVALTRFSFGSHTGTHIDAPSHFLQNGKTLDKIPLNKLIGKCRVLDLTGIKHQEIQVSDLSERNITKGDRILLKTGNFRLLRKATFPKKYISLSLEAAEFLVKKEVVLVGTDFLSIEKKANPNHPVHKALLSKGIVNVEGLNLENVPAGKYEMICLPLHVVGVDGAPARVILVER